MERVDMKRIKREEDEAAEKMKKFPNFIENLPEEVAFNIFSMLPLKSVFKFFCVKKSWRQLLTPMVGNPDFGEKLLRNSLQKDRDGATGFLLLMKRHRDTDHYEVHLAEQVNSSYNKVSRITFPFWASNPLKMEYNRMIGSVNGLVCLGLRIHETTLDFDPIHVFNPFLKESIHLPRINNYSHQKSDTTNLAMGFGFHTTTNHMGFASNTYKILRIYYRQQPEVGEVEIYTLGGEGGWRTLETTNYQLQSYKPGVLVAGRLYWLINHPVLLVYFDLETEMFGELPPPPNMPIPDADTSSHLNDFGGGKLCITQVNDGDLVFWVFMDGNWIIKTMTLNTMGQFYHFRPYYFMKDMDEVLLLCATLTREVVLGVSRFDNDNGAVNVVMRMGGQCEADIVPHTKSLVSLIAMGGVMMN